jgi:hypothetical protein
MHWYGKGASLFILERGLVTREEHGNGLWAHKELLSMWYKEKKDRPQLVAGSRARSVLGR